MSVTVNIDHEVGDLTQYTSTTTDGGNLSVTAAAALAGTGYGLQCLVNDNNNIYGWKTITKSALLRLRFYVDPNSIAMANNDQHSLWTIEQRGGWWRNILRVNNIYYGSAYHLKVEVNNDANSWADDNVIMSDAPHYVEVLLTRAATSTSADGSMQWWFDGVDQGTIGSLDNYNLMQDADWGISFGMMSIDTGTRGTVYLDELICNNDGGLIGPVVVAAKSLLIDSRPRTLAGILAR